MKKDGEAIEALGLKPLDRLLGAGVGVVAAGLLVGAGLLALGSSTDPKVHEKLAGSKLTPYVVERMRMVLAAIPDACREDFLQALRRLDNAAQIVAVDLTTDNLRSATQRMNQVSEGVRRTRTIPTPRVEVPR